MRDAELLGAIRADADQLADLILEGAAADGAAAGAVEQGEDLVEVGAAGVIGHGGEGAAYPFDERVRGAGIEHHRLDAEFAGTNPVFDPAVVAHDLVIDVGGDADVMTGGIE